MQVDETLDLQISEFKKDVFKELSEKLQAENAAFKAANTQYLADLKITKDSITELLAKIGLINDKGQIGQMDFMMLSKTILNVMRMSDEKKKQEFACIVNMIPVFEKYKDL